MMRWSREHDFDDLIAAAVAADGGSAVSVTMVKGVIAHESQFNPDAIGDDGNSLGLMQVQPNTARAVGVLGTLFDPATNLKAGVRYLAQQITTARGVDAGLSAYNGGYRPTLGFGAPLASGSFRNQAYVDAVKEKWFYFDAQQREEHAAPPTEASATLHSWLLIGAAGIAGVVLWLLFGR